MTRLRGLVEVRRETVNPSEMPASVDHYSIPALDATGAPEQVASSTIDSHKILLRGGEILVSRLNPRKPRVHAIPSRLSRVSVCSTEFVSLEPRSIDHRYLRYLLLSEHTRQHLDSHVRSATRSHQRVEPGEILALEAVVTEREQQRRIADFLDDRVARIDKIITARREQEKVLHERFESLRLDAVLGKHRTRPTDLPWAPAVPESWAVRRLSQLARMGTGHTPSRSEPSYWVDCDVSWLTTTDVHKFRRDEIDVIESTEISISALGLANSAAVLHPSNTVALSRTASAGFSVIMGRPMATSQDFVTWTCGQDLLPEYLLHTLRVMRPYLLGFLSIGSTHKTIYFPDLMDLRIPVPPLRYQSDAVARVVEAAASRNSALTAIRQQVVLLTEYKQSLITAAVTGELGVTTAGSGIPE